MTEWQPELMVTLLDFLIDNDSQAPNFIKDLWDDGLCEDMKRLTSDESAILQQRQ